MSPGDACEVYAYGRWYAGTIDRIGRTLVQVKFTTAAGNERMKRVRPVPSLLRIVSPIVAITSGETVGTWNVFRRGAFAAEPAEAWTDEMQAWHEQFYATRGTA